MTKATKKEEPATDIVPIADGGFLVLADEESLDMLIEAAPAPTDLAKLLVPSGTSGAAFVIEDLEGETFHKELDVVVAFESKPERAFYATDVGEGEAGPPHCSSPDSVTGLGVRDVQALQDVDGNIEALGVEPTEQECAKCPFSKFDSALSGGRGQACKQKMRLVVFTPDNLLPLVLQVPPTSLKPLKQHKLRLLNARQKMSQTVTKLSLRKKEGSPDYYVVEFSFSRKLGGGELERLGKVAETLLRAAAS